MKIKPLTMLICLAVLAVVGEGQSQSRQPELSVALNSPLMQTTDITFYTTNGIPIPIDWDNYRALIDGDVEQVQTSQHLIRRRLGSQVVSKDSTVYPLYLEVFDTDGEFMGMKVHNLSKAKLSKEIDLFMVK